MRCPVFLQLHDFGSGPGACYNAPVSLSGRLKGGQGVGCWRQAHSLHEGGTSVYCHRPDETSIGSRVPGLEPRDTLTKDNGIRPSHDGVSLDTMSRTPAIKRPLAYVTSPPPGDKARAERVRPGGSRQEVSLKIVATVHRPHRHTIPQACPPPKYERGRAGDGKGKETAKPHKKLFMM